MKREEVAGYVDDPELRACVERHMSKAKEARGGHVAAIERGRNPILDRDTRSTNEHGYDDLYWPRDAFDAEGCLLNRGIRVSREYKGRFTYGDVKTEVPFDNDMTVVMLPGRVLREAIAFTRAMAPKERGCFLQVDDAMRVDPITHQLLEVAALHSMNLVGQDSDREIYSLNGPH
ncbi:MAG: 5'-nucleotidase C-terminal domain-containing protein [Polyangiaceae bacterium]